MQVMFGTDSSQILKQHILAHAGLSPTTPIENYDHFIRTAPGTRYVGTQNTNYQGILRQQKNGATTIPTFTAPSKNIYGPDTAIVLPIGAWSHWHVQAPETRMTDSTLAMIYDRAAPTEKMKRTYHASVCPAVPHSPLYENQHPVWPTQHPMFPDRSEESSYHDSPDVDEHDPQTPDDDKAMSDIQDGTDDINDLALWPSPPNDETVRVYSNATRNAAVRRVQDALTAKQKLNRSPGSSNSSPKKTRRLAPADVTPSGKYTLPSALTPHHLTQPISNHVHID